MLLSAFPHSSMSHHPSMPINNICYMGNNIMALNNNKEFKKRQINNQLKEK